MSAELFFAKIRIIFDPTTSKLIEAAWFMSEYGHANQKRDNGRPYSDHPQRAAWIYLHELGGRDPIVIIDLLLHDIKEDQHILSWFIVKKVFGEDVALDLHAMTKLKTVKETVEEYGARMLERGPRVITAKLCDRLHNLRDLACTVDEKRERHIRETEEYYLPVFIPELRKYGGLWEEHADQLEKLISQAIEEYRSGK
jgi:GTP pyrophosphokinase